MHIFADFLVYARLQDEGNSLMVRLNQPLQEIFETKKIPLFQVGAVHLSSLTISLQDTIEQERFRFTRWAQCLCLSVYSTRSRVQIDQATLCF